MTDFGGKEYVAVYDQFKVRQTIQLDQTWCPFNLMSMVDGVLYVWLIGDPIFQTRAWRLWWWSDDGWRSDQYIIMTLSKDQTQVGRAADGYVLTVGGFNDALSTLGDALDHNMNGMKFSTK